MFDQALHDKIKRKNKAIALIVSFLVLVFSVLRMFMTRFFVDPDIHFYIETTNIFVLSVDYIIAACVVLIYVISLFIYKRKLDNHNYAEVSDCFVQGTQTQVFSASLTALLFIFAAGFQAYSFINPGNSLAEIQGLSVTERFIAYIQNYPFDFAIFFVSVFCAVYYFKTAALNFDIGENIGQATVRAAEGEETKEEKPAAKVKHKYSSAHVIFSFMPIIWAFLNVFKCFFDMSKSVNSPLRIYELISFLALSAYFVSESRMLVERRELSKFFTFSYIAVIVTAVSALPNLIWSSFWMLQTNNGQIVYALEISLAVYIFSRIYSQIRYGRFLLHR